MTGVADPSRRALVNAQGALEVVRTASEAVDDRLSGIDERTATQAAEMQAVVDDVSELSATIEEVAASARAVDEQTTRAADEAATGRAAAAAATASMESVRERSEGVSEDVRRLQDRIDRIEDALAGIDRIADQTDMLALNASIEAARSEGDNEGFAVVAEEIKSLAAESQAQSEVIAETLAEVRSATDDTVESLQQAVAEIDDAAGEVQRAADSLAGVAETVEATAEETTAVSEATDEQATVSETVAQRCEQAAQRARDIEDVVETIRATRAEQTAMLREVEGAIEDATPELSAAAVETVTTRVPALDENAGGLVQGGRAVIRYDGAAVADLVAQLCAGVLSGGYAVSLTPPPALDREMLANALEQSPGRLLEEDRLFVLDAFGTWQPTRNVFDLGSSSLSAVNRTTVDRRSAPLLVVGNVAAEVRTLGEQTAREARYENDGSVFETRDTVLNVVDDGTVDETFGAFYAGAADQVFEVIEEEGTRQFVVRQSPTGDSTARSLPERVHS